jgi:hypothetical protein
MLVEKVINVCEGQVVNGEQLNISMTRRRGDARTRREKIFPHASLFAEATGDKLRILYS